ncbi:unnamed protein product, partial [Meganyctiphanes norvegica]
MDKGNLHDPPNGVPECSVLNKETDDNLPRNNKSLIMSLKMRICCSNSSNNEVSLSTIIKEETVPLMQNTNNISEEIDSTTSEVASITTAVNDRITTLSSSVVSPTININMTTSSTAHTNVNIVNISSPKSIGTDEVNILKLFMGLRRTGPVSKALAQIFVLLSQLGNRSVKQYCTEVLGYSNRQFSAAFTSAERSLLDGVWDPFEMDITMLYKLLQRVCGLASPGDEKWSMSADTIEFHLYTLKKERNELAHEGVQIDDAQLKKKYTVLEDII